jgi:hypothetical protein
MKTLYGNAGSGPASKSIQRKTSQIPPYGYIAAIGLVASAEQAYAKQVGVSDVVTSTNINPHDSSDVLLDLSSLDVSALPLIQQIYMPLLLICPAAQPPSGTATQLRWSPASRLSLVF